MRNGWFSSYTDLVFANVFKRGDDAMYQNKASMKERARERDKTQSKK